MKRGIFKVSILQGGGEQRGGQYPSRGDELQGREEGGNLWGWGGKIKNMLGTV